jgi:transcriptional regulator with XRE-family HTH domain
MPARTYVCDKDVIERLRRERGLALEALAAEAGIHLRTLRRVLSGKPAYLSTLTQLARPLGVPVAALVKGSVADSTPVSEAQSAFNLTLTVDGVALTEHAIAPLEAAQKLTAYLVASGCSVAAVQAGIRVDEAERTIMLVFGFMAHGGPCWIYAAVRPSKQQAFSAAHKDGSLDLHAFDAYGEIVVSGEGRLPPDEVTSKVNSMYGVKIPLLDSGLRDMRRAK